MREFLLYAQEAVTEPFSLNNLSGSGRMDVIVRCVSSTFFLSSSLRKDSNLYISLNGPPRPPVLLSFLGSELKGLYYDERSIAGKIREALRLVANKNRTRVSKGFYAERISFRDFIKDFAEKRRLVYLHQNGKDIRDTRFLGNELFILGDHGGLPQKEEKFLDSIGAERISVGPEIYLASHCIVLVHNEIDRKCSEGEKGFYGEKSG